MTANQQSIWICAMLKYCPHRKKAACGYQSIRMPLPCVLRALDLNIGVNTVKAGFRASGFSLIELMIVVVVIAILAAVALPSYGDYIRRSQLQEAFAKLADYRVKLEQYYQDNRNYGTNQCGDGVPLMSFATLPGERFGWACALNAGGQGYTLTATGNLDRAVGHTYTLNTANAKATSVFKGGAVAKTCWLVRGDEC
jgi:type IV pilus assembly protein PilE